MPIDLASPPRKPVRTSKPAPEPIPLTAEAIPEQGPLTPAQNMMLCAGCVRCCTYVAVEVDAPDTPWQYDQYVWLLYHKNIWMYVEKGNHWYVQFETVCDKLSPTGSCNVHGTHPVLCKKYDARECERRGELSDIIARFRDGDDLVRWLAEKRPKHHARYAAWFAKEHGTVAPPAAGAAPAKNRAKTAYFEMPPPPVNPLLGPPPAPAPLRRVVKKTTRKPVK